MMRSLVDALFLAAVVFPTPVHAYIDPGAGSMMAQMLVGVIIGLFFWFRGRITGLLTKIKSLFR